MIDFTYWIIIFLVVLMAVALYFRSFWLGIFVSMGMMVLGVHIIGEGIQNVNVFLTQTIGILFIMIGAYVMIRGWIERFEEGI